MRVHSRLQEIRKMRGVSAVDLAHRVGVSRQTIYAIEDGRFTPNTSVSLQLARVLDVSVEEIFSIAQERMSKPLRATLLTKNQESNKAQLVRICHVKNRLVAVPISPFPAYLPSVDAVIESRKQRSFSIDSATEIPENGRRLLIAGCDPALSLLNELLSPAGIEIVTVSASSRCALRWLKEGRVHAAGSHLLDRASGDYNLPVIRSLFPGASVRVVTFAVWEQGLVLRRSNPKNIRSLADLGETRATIINREKGSGSRDLLDNGLRKLGIPHKQINGYNHIAEGHLAAAYAVGTGWADCCIAPRSAARCFALEFAPLAVERFDLSFTQASLALPAAKALLDLLNRAPLRRKLQSIAGYDTGHTGEVLS